jgi:tRNA pseudouridine65 synthase
MAFFLTRPCVQAQFQQRVGSFPVLSRQCVTMCYFHAHTEQASQLCVTRRTLCAQQEMEESLERWEPPCIPKLYEDEFVIAISKPGTLLVHDNKGASMEEKQRNAFAKNLVETQYTQGRRVNPVNRLDRAASGVMLFAKSSAAARAAQSSLSHPSCVKEYVVLARGCTPDFFVCDEPVKDENGISRSALTECEKVLDLPEARCSLLKVVIKTGRWHQIRKHLNHRAYHVVGDVKHGKGGTNRFFRENYKMQSGRIFLHAAHLSLLYPFPLVNLESESFQHTNKGLDNYEASLKSDLSVTSLSSSFPRELKKSIENVVPRTPTALWDADPNSGCQVLTIRATLPEDLQQVLYALPENLSKECLLSHGLIF